MEHPEHRRHTVEHFALAPLHASSTLLRVHRAAPSKGSRALHRAAVLRMPILLTEAQRHELDTRGWFVVERVLQGAELERVSAAFDEVADRKRALDGLDDGVTGASSTTAR